MNTLDDKHERRLAAKRRYYAKHAEETKVAARVHYLTRSEEVRKKLLERGKRYRAAHLEERRACQRKSYYKWRDADPERARITAAKYSRRRYLADPERANAANRRSYAKLRDTDPTNFRDMRRVRAARRRARKVGAAGFNYTTQQHLEWRRQMWGGRCYLCGAENAKAVDHVIPLSKGGSHWPANLRPCCTSCNSSKHDKLLVEYLGLKKVEAVA